MESFELKPVGNAAEEHRSGSALLGAMETSNGPITYLPCGATVEQVIWSVQRSPVPPEFAGKVTDDMWESTWDAVHAQTHARLEYNRIWAQPPDCMDDCCPCFAVGGCAGANARKELRRQHPRGPEQQAARRNVGAGWLALEAVERERYAPYGIHVCLTHESKTVIRNTHGNANTTRSVVYWCVGLKFGGEQTQTSIGMDGRTHVSLLAPSAAHMLRQV